jgi:hypothetical protein
MTDDFKVTMNEPAAPKPAQGKLVDVIVRDGLGRNLTLRRPPLLSEFRITAAVGPQLAANSTYMQMLMPLIFLAAIDGEPVDLPMNQRHAEALIQRVGHEGYAAVITGIEKHFANSDASLAGEVKNSAGTPD